EGGKKSLPHVRRSVMEQSSRLVGAGIVFGVAALFSFLYVGFLSAVGIALAAGLLGFLLLSNSKLVAVFTIPELRQKIFITLICLIQAFFLVQSFMRDPQYGGQGWAKAGYTAWVWPTMVVTLTAGTVFLMWMGEQIDEYGVGNGISLIIMAGIVARFPEAMLRLLTENGELRASILTLGGTGPEISFEKVVVLMTLFDFVVVAVVAITEGH